MRGSAVFGREQRKEATLLALRVEAAGRQHVVHLVVQRCGALGDDVEFLMPFVDLGLVPEAASSLLLPRLAGRKRAARYLLLGEPFGAEEALDAGIVSHVAPPGQLTSAFADFVGSLISKPAQSLRMTQHLLRRGQTDELLERMELENGHFSERLTSAEVREAISGFFASRAKA